MGKYALDIHKNSVFARILDEQSKKIEKLYGAFIPDLIALCDALVEKGCENVAMGSTNYLLDAYIACSYIRFFVKTDQFLFY